MSSEQIYITGMGSISSVGHTTEKIKNSYALNKSFIKTINNNGKAYLAAPLSEESEELIKNIKKSSKKYSSLDKTVLMSIYASRKAMEQCGWKNKNYEYGINLGSSRGATELFEKYHHQFLNHPENKVPVLTSPTTTLGNISSWVGNDLMCDGPIISHSVTCSTSMHSFCNAFAWLKSGMADRMLVGGSEAPLTPFTFSQMEALKIYSTDFENQFPCRPLSSEPNRKSKMILGEGAAIFAFEKLSKDESLNDNLEIVAKVNSIGYGAERITHSTYISPEGTSLKNSMLMALKNDKCERPVDLIIMHAPGTVAGDNAELNAINEVFKNKLPNLLTNKWIIGHTFGASGALSLEYALNILKNNRYEDFPYPVVVKNKQIEIRKILINSAGFGGNSASIIISLPF